MRRAICLGVVVCWFGLNNHLGAAEPVFRAGAATSNITPDIGGDIVGGFAPSPSKHIHDDLHARCLVLDDGVTRLAIVVCDLLGIHRKVSEEARLLIAETTGIPRDNVLISATHTHSATSALGERRYLPDPPLTDYQKFVVRRISDGVRRAIHNLKPAQIAFGSVDIPEHVFNRRWTMRPGTMPPNPFGGIDLVKMNPPAGSPNLEEPAGPTDPAVSILALREPDGRPISVFATYSLHYVGGVGPDHISADYFGMFAEHLKDLVNQQHDAGEFVALLANGTSGDINNINFRTPRPGKPAYAQMRYVAQDVAAKVHATLAGLEYRDTVRLDARYREPELNWRRPTPEQVAWAKTTLEAKPAEPGKTDLSRVYAERTLALAEYPATTTVPVQVLAIGEVAIGTMPCEVFCEIGLEFRDRSPLQPGFMVSLAHGYFGYLPTPRHHDLGGYETWIGTNRLEREASVKLLDQLVEMTQEIQGARAK
ncbi:MAG: neutral/alkaline non-lysosomal ceramidase N-terminal domain-containing protein [Planctomycetaceae bacterium]|nr:neutral/alkaline non-lysosomal ceramidase N-terminal domain-containing protein [Planctomycetaceae bacterium]